MIVMIPMLFGLMGVGITLGRTVQGQQVVRDSGHMHAQGVDMSTQDAKDIVAKIAQDYNLSATSGNAVLILSQIIKVYAGDCSAAGVSTVNCQNSGYSVFTHRITYGNPALRVSEFGTPGSAYISSTGNINAVNYLQLPALRATGFSGLVTQLQGDVAYVVEGFFSQPDLNFFQPGFPQINQGTYVRNIF